MNQELKQKITEFVEEEIVAFHRKREAKLRKTNLSDLLERKNPYLFRAKDFVKAADLIEALLDAKLSSSEEAMFGHFMELLAIFIVKQVFGGDKTSTGGLDLTFSRDGILYLVAVKSGKNWGNSSSIENLRKKFKTAVATLKQNKHIGEIQPVLGICYAHFPKKHEGDYFHVGGQDFWELLSGDPHLFRELIEPIGHRAQEFNEDFEKKRGAISNSFTVEFVERFCFFEGEEKGLINWRGLIEFVSTNRAEAQKKAVQAPTRRNKA